MSFSFEFFAKVKDAKECVEKEHAPDSVKAFVKQALSAWDDDKMVHIKANGHLYEGKGSYVRSSCDLVIEEVTLRQP